MWPEVGTKVEEKLTDLSPVRILYELDGPRIFLCRDAAGDLLLAYQCEEEDDLARFLVVPFDDDWEIRLTTGAISVREALQQPRLWVADVANDWAIQQIRRIRIDDVPYENLPRPGTMLWPQLQPILSLRAVGKEITHGAVRGRIIQETVSRADGAIRALVEYAGTKVEIAAELIKRLSEPPAHRFALRSFEVSFRAPDLGDLDEASKTKAAEVYRVVGDLLRSGLDLVHREEGTTASHPTDVGRQEAILKAAVALSPSGRTDVEEVHLSGTLVGKTELHPAKLTKTAHRQASSALQKLQKRDEPSAPLQFRGFIRQITDRKPYQFVLYTREKDEKIYFEVEGENERLWVDAVEAIKAHAEVIVSGKRLPNSAHFSTIAIHPVSV